MRYPLKIVDLPVPPFILEPGSTAVLIQDALRFYLDPGAGLEARARELGLAAELAEFREQAATAAGEMQRLLAAARSLDLAIIHAHTDTGLESAEAGAVLRGRGWSIRPDEPPGEPAPGLEPRPGETVIPKPGLSAFAGTELARHLRQRGLRTLIVAGVVSDDGVAATVRDAAERGTEVVIAADACAGSTRAAHEFALTSLVGASVKQRVTFEICRRLQRMAAEGRVNI